MFLRPLFLRVVPVHLPFTTYPKRSAVDTARVQLTTARADFQAINARLGDVANRRAGRQQWQDAHQQ